MTSADQQDAPTKAAYRPDIDGLRAIAVVSVLLFHVGFLRFRGGFVGVDIFFVISGFLITGIIRREAATGTFSFRRFYVRRLRRLFPALAATVLLTLVASAAFFAPDLFQSVGASSVAAILSVSNIYFWLDSGYFDVGNSVKPLLHTWSLGVEEQFYLVWPVILAFAVRRGVAAPALVVLFVGSLAAGVLLPVDPSATFYLMPFRVYELALGGLMVFVVERVRLRGVVLEACLLLALVLMAYAVLTFRETTPYPMNGLVPSVGAALAILAGTAPVLGIVLRNPVSVFIGLISYSVYLVHWPIVVLYRYVVGAELGRGEQVGLLVAAILGGYALHWLVERRFRYARPTSTGARRFVLASVGVATVVTALGLHAAATGWTWRLGDREVAYLNMRSFYGGDGCGPGPETKEQVHICETGQGRPLVVIGDSHAMQYLAGFARHLPNRKVMIFESDSCPFFSIDATRDFVDPELVRYDEPCRSTKHRAFDEIRRTGADVIVAQNWSKVPMVSERSAERWAFKLDSDWAKFAGEELQQLRAELGIGRLLVIGDVPTSGGQISPVDCLARPIRRGDVGCAATPISNPILTSKRDFNQVLRESVGSEIAFEDPFDYLCGPAACDNMRDGMTLYSSRTHLSKSGSELVIGAMIDRASRTDSVLADS